MEEKKFNGIKLREKRMELGLSQLELANEVNRKYGASIVDVTTISRWEINPNAVPRNNKLVKVATVLGCKVEELYDYKNILQEKVLSMENLIKELIKDSKKLYIAEIIDGKEDDDALTLLMKSWNTSFKPGAKIKDYENRTYACEMYEKFGWEKKIFDVICSVWTTYIALLVTYTQENNIKYEKFNNYIKINKLMYYYSENKHLGYWYWEGKEKQATFSKNNKKFQESSYYSKFLDDKNVHSKVAKEIAEEVDDIQKLSALCHCVANFMPCPDPEGEKYNSIKGFLPDVRDYFPLMIDKIQKCISQNEELNYKEYKISLDVLNKWHKWFSDNRKKHFLEEFFYITKKDNKEILIGIPLFKGQSLDNPMPNTLSEAKESIESMLEIIQNRALKMASFIMCTF